MTNTLQQSKNTFPSSLVENPSLVSLAYYYTDVDGSIWVGYANNWVRFRTQTSDLTSLFALLDGSHPLETLLEDAHILVPRLSKKQLLQVLQTLASKGLLIAGNPPLSPIFETEPNYLERHACDLELYALFEKENVSRYDYLARIKSSKVVVIGLGGVGTWVSLPLACMGIGELVGVDFDTVELSNLVTQVLYTPDDLGRTKTTVSQTFFSQFTPEMQFHPHCIRISEPNDVAPLIKDADFVVLAADWPPGQLWRWVNQACVEAGIPVLFVSDGISHIRIGLLVLPGQSSCYECYYLQCRQHEEGFAALERATQQVDWSADPAPAFSPLFGLLGHRLSWEVLCALTGILQPCTVDHLLQLDLLTFETRLFPVVKQPSCAVCAMSLKSEQGVSSGGQETSFYEGDDHE